MLKKKTWMMVDDFMTQCLKHILSFINRKITPVIVLLLLGAIFVSYWFYIILLAVIIFLIVGYITLGTDIPNPYHRSKIR